MDRKEFIRKSLQLGIAAGMLSGTAILLKRNQVDVICKPDQFCKNCSKFEGCELDKAKLSRENER
ncbi:hypothetical protein ACUNWD_15640 [Sunxiuqinia sp. A32]|uniref:hypothetical protein n=1 Tax=Sunxiuqinia sp. A32 TaxID=3461496 RepID=UPI0040457FAE